MRRGKQVAGLSRTRRRALFIAFFTSGPTPASMETLTAPTTVIPVVLLTTTLPVVLPTTILPVILPTTILPAVSPAKRQSR